MKWSGMVEADSASGVARKGGEDERNESDRGALIAHLDGLRVGYLYNRLDVIQRHRSIDGEYDRLKE
jgi:hypothetical protein